MRMVKKNVIISLITLVLIASGIIYIVSVKGYWFYGTYTWDHSNIKRYTEEDYNKSTEFELLFQGSNQDSDNPAKIKERQEKLTKMIESGLEVNCPAPSYDIESTETYYVGLPLAVACSYKNYEIAKLLIEKGAVVGRIKGIPSPIDVTLSFYDKDDIEEKGMDINQGLEFPQFFTPLIGACYDNTVDTAKYLLEHGADKNLVNSEGKKAVDYATTEEMKALLNQYH